jgi:hypothetical protein
VKKLQKSTGNMFNCGSDGLSICKNPFHSCKYFAEILDDLVFSLDGVDYTIPPTGYLLQSLSGFGCSVLVSTVDDEMGIMILGDPFFRSFYISFDYVANTISMAPSVTPPKLRDQMSVWLVIGLMVGSVIFTAVSFNL